MNPEVEALTKRVQALEAMLFNIVYQGGEYRFLRNVKFGPNATLSLNGNLALGDSGSLIGMYGVTPIARQAAVTAPGGGTVIDIQARAAITDVISRIRTIGITN